MKVYIISLIAAFSLSSSCRKEDFAASPDLVGKWKLKDTYYSIGGPLIYQDAPQAAQIYLNFGDDGSLEDTKDLYTSYHIKDSITLTFVRKDKRRQDFHYHISDSLLNLSPAGSQACIEGCGSRYRKID